MKRIFAFLPVALLAAATSAPLFAQSSDAAAAIADKQGDEERYKRLNSLLEDVQTTQTQQIARMDDVLKKLAGLRDEHIKQSAGYASLEDLKKLATAIEEVDRKREAENKLIRDELAKLLKAVADAQTTPAPRVRPPVDPKPVATETADPPTDGKPRKGYEYTIRDKDTLSVIVAAYREQGIKTSVEEIKKANPGLIPERMSVGKKIFIPQPKE